MAAPTLVRPLVLPASEMAVEADDSRLQDALRLATSMAAQVRAFAFDLDFGDLELPSAETAQEDLVRLRSAAPLYFASELESARLLPALEVFAGIWASGGIPADLGPMGETLTRYHRERHARLTTAEREALFGRLFGKAYGPDLAVESPRNVGFDSLFTELAASLTDWHSNAARWGGTAADVVRARTAARQLATSLSSRAGGVAAFAAGEILGDIRFAIDVFKDIAVQRALGASSMWNTVSNVTRRFLQQQVDVNSHVERARSGLTLLAWLAGALPSLESGQAALPEDEIVTHAMRWMQATLALHERGQPFRA